MPDYTMNTGTTGQMLIRDLGNIVQFWITSNNFTTFDHEMPWSYIVNGYAYPGELEHDYVAGSGWNLLQQWSVPYSQTVRFKLGATGTAGLGGPTTFDQFIFRPVVPSSPSVPVIGTISSTSVAITFTDGADGGSPIDAREIGYGTNASAPTVTMASDGSDTVTGLTPGTTYYFWARTHNVVGWSAWSARAEAKTYRVPFTPSAPILSDVGPVSMTVSWTAPNNGGTAITAYEVGYGTTNVNPPASSEAGTSPHDLDGLTPGMTYYIRVRAQNAVGWGAWSDASNADTLAGAHISIGGVVKFAVPYVNDDGVWKIAIPFVKDAGVWKETI